MEEGDREGLKSAEVGRPAATCPTTEDGAGELEADGGKVTQAPPLLSSSSSSSSFRNAFPQPRYTYGHTPHVLSQFSASFICLTFHLTSNLTPNNKISFTSNSSPTYMKVKRSGATSVC